MVFLLISFLAIALIVTLVGLVLSARNRISVDRVGYPAERARYGVAGPVRIRTGYRAVEPVRARRYWQEERYVHDGSWGGRFLGGIYRRRDGSTNWTTTTITLVAMFLLGLYLLVGLLPGHAFIGYIPFYGNQAASSSSSQGQNAPRVYGASAALVRLSQLDPAQYDSSAQYNTWAQSTCSTTSMTEVLNAYGHHYRISDILKVEAGLGEITPQLGLVESVGIQRTVAQFGFKTTWGTNYTLDQVIGIANQGRPVIVDFPPYKYAGGHLLVVTGGNANYVYLADSSIFNRRVLTHAQFLQWWAGFAAVVTPQ
jgi:hypothetical protein